MKVGPLSGLIFNRSTVADRKELDDIFSEAVNKTETPFSFCEEPEWFDFFNAMNNDWKVPSPEVLGGSLLDDVYKKSISEMIFEVKGRRSGTLDFDGATNCLSKSIRNLAIHLQFQ